MKNIYLLMILFLLSSLFAQNIYESELKCAHSNTVRTFNMKYSLMTVAQNNFDANFYDINLDVIPEEEKIYGTVGIVGTALISNFSEVELDLNNVMTIESIKDDQNNQLNYTHSNNIIYVTLNSSINNGDQFRFIVKYNGKPQSSGLGSFGFDEYPRNSGIPMIWSLSEPYGAREWWPCKDTPLDKADSVNITVTVPKDLIVASNGLLADTELNNDKKIFYWEERYPIATYLVSIAIHPYIFFYDWYKYSASDSMRLEYYVFPDNYDDVQENYGLTKDMIAAMSQRFGEYPFIKEKYGHAEFVWGGGMEHQTLSSMGGHSEALIAHELGHQWWGDMVTCASFHHIWLNEGFATYGEALWYEIRDNDIQSLHDDMANNRYYYFQYPDGRNGNYENSSIYVADTTSTSRIFDGSLTYAKAAWVVHMLRHIVGDENFFDGLREYGDRYRFKSAVTEDLQDVMEEISGQDLNYFFQRWIYGELYPIYNVVYNQTGDNLLVKITQTADREVFEMPIDLKIDFDDGSTNTTVIHNSLREEYFKVNVGSKTVAQIELDPDNWVLRKIESIKLDTLSDGGKINDFILFPSYPNPFNSDVAIKFNLHKGAPISISIYDLNGLKIWDYSESYNPGTHIVNWNGVNKTGNKVPTGTYYVEVSNDKTVKSNKILLLK